MPIDEARKQIMEGASEVSRLFRIGASVQFAPLYVVPAIVTFLDRYPDVELDLHLSDTSLDLIEHRLDMVVRIGEPVSSSLKSRLIARLRRVVVASPEYLSHHGYPGSVSDLKDHNCIVRTFGPEGDRWPLIERGSVIRIPVEGRFRCNDAATANSAVLQGTGVGMMPLWQVRREIELGLLEILLPDNDPPLVTVYALWPEGAVTSFRTRIFVKILKQHILASGCQV